MKFRISPGFRVPNACAPLPCSLWLSLRFIIPILCLLTFLEPVQAGLFAKIEASFDITSGISTDPVVLFDYAQTDVEVTLLQPDMSSITVPAFYDGGTTWRVRHSPPLPGTYTISGITLNGSPISVANLQPSSWTVAGQPFSPGYVQVDPSNPEKFVTGNGRRYFPRGENVAWDVGTYNATNIFPRMAAAHENWSRQWMTHWDGKNLDWNPDGTAPGPLGTLNLAVARKWDAYVALADQAGVSFQMTLQHHGQYSSSVDSNWGYNPYNVTNPVSTIGFLSNPVQFFTNVTAKAVTKRKLRYAIARWGYSPSIMAWELFNEVQFTDAGLTGQWNLVGAWHDEMAAFLHAQDPWHHLVTTSSDLTQPIWNQCDYYTHHDYPNDVIAGLRDPADLNGSQPVKPVFGAECGTNGTPRIGVNGALWPGLMSAQSGAEQPWWWDGMDQENDYPSFRAVSDFITFSGLVEQDGLVKLVPQVSSADSGPLLFGLGGGWGMATQDTFTVGNSAPDGIGSAPSYLQGNYHRSMTPNGYTFLVNYPQPGTFGVQVLIIAASGAGLSISVDGIVQTNISWTGTGSDVSTNFNTAVPVSAGSHTILLWNPGLDWIDLGNLTLTPYVPLLGTYAIGNTNFIAAWVWHRTNVFNLSAASTTAGTITLAGLNPGNYSATWWDTFAGVATSNFTFTVVNSNGVSVASPAVLRSAALFAGLAPQAGLSAPSCVLTLGSNSPPAVVPLILTNGGGLPLSYSLCVTGVSPVLYTSSDSTQPGGPVYRWQDISGVGTDITATFTAVAPPKTATDEGISGPINIGFGFPYFSGAQAPTVVTQLWVSPNGYVTFSPFIGDTSTNSVLPGNLAPSNCIAFFWRDLDLGPGGRIYAATDAVNKTFTLQFQAVRFKTGSGTVTCQLILKSTGEILLQYQSVMFANTCAVGLQNADRTQGLTVVRNSNYLQSQFAVRLTPTRWFSLYPGAGALPKALSDTVNATFNPSNLPYGSYMATLQVATSDPLNPLFTIPVELDVTPRATWRQAYFGTAANSGTAADWADPDHDGIVNLLEYAFNRNPTVADTTPPVTWNLSGGGTALVLTFLRPHPAPTDISYVVEVTDDLNSGVWNSGPAYVTITVTDNGNGTETVTATDLKPFGSSTTHFIRVRIVPQ